MDDSVRAKISWHIGRITGLSTFIEFAEPLMEEELKEVIKKIQKECVTLETYLTKSPPMQFNQDMSWILGNKNDVY